MIAHLGVSKAILTHVIFCHQEESTWSVFSITLTCTHTNTHHTHHTHAHTHHTHTHAHTHTRTHAHTLPTWNAPPSTATGPWVRVEPWRPNLMRYLLPHDIQKPSKVSRSFAKNRLNIISITFNLEWSPTSSLFIMILCIVSLSVFLSVCGSVCLSVCVSVSVSADAGVQSSQCWVASPQETKGEGGWGEW